MDQGPEREWGRFLSRSWLKYMPPVREQHTDMLPLGPGETETKWAGSCLLHAYSESVTGRLRIKFKDKNFGVNLVGLIHYAAANGVLSKNGTRLYMLDALARCVGIPLEGDPPPQAPRVTRPPGFALGTEVAMIRAVPLPFHQASHEEFEEAMAYREKLCSHLEKGPIVVCFEMQNHFGEDTSVAEPYRRLEDESNYTTVLSEDGMVRVRAGHCVCVYGYTCPGGDVRTLTLKYQDSAEGAVDTGYMDPDAIQWAYVPDIENVVFSNDPVRGGSQMLQQLHPPAPPASSWFWDAFDYLTM